MNSAGYYFGGRRFPTEALHLICCCALFTTYTPEQLQDLFVGRLPKNRNWLPIASSTLDLDKVQASEIRGCFFHMAHHKFYIHQLWSSSPAVRYPLYLLRTLEPLTKAGLPATTQICLSYSKAKPEPYHRGVDFGIAEPWWGEK